MRLEGVSIVEMVEYINIKLDFGRPMNDINELKINNITKYMQIDSKEKSDKKTDAIQKYKRFKRK